MQHTHYRFTHDHAVTGGSHGHGVYAYDPNELSDADKLRLLADWFDGYDRRMGRSYENPPGHGDQVQRDLRRIADELDIVNKVRDEMGG